jgi:hypothetical protein
LLKKHKPKESARSVGDELKARNSEAIKAILSLLRETFRGSERFLT